MFDYAPGWKPEPGDTVMGTVKALDNGYSQWGEYKIVTLIQENGEEVAVHAFHTVLENALKRIRPVPGDKIAIRYVGEQTPKGDPNGKPFHVYQVRSMDAKGEEFWGKPTAARNADAFNDEPPF